MHTAQPTYQCTNGSHVTHPPPPRVYPPFPTGDGGSAAGESDSPRLNMPHLQELIGKEALQYRPAHRLSQVARLGDVQAGDGNRDSSYVYITFINV